MPKVKKSQLIELLLPGIASGNQTTKIQFPDQPYLRFKKILGIEALTVNDMTLSPGNKTPISQANLKASYLTLYLNDPGNVKDIGEWIQDVPLTILHRIQNSANDPFARQMFDLVGQVVYWEKCYVTLPIAFGNTTDLSFLFQVYFEG